MPHVKAAGLVGLLVAHPEVFLAERTAGGGRGKWSENEPKDYFTRQWLPDRGFG